MRTQLLDLAQQGAKDKPFEISFSLLPFVAYLKSRLVASSGRQQQQLTSILNQIEAHPQWDAEIDTHNIDQYSELFELVYTTLTSPLINEQENFWAMALPFSPKLVFGTDAFYRFLETADGVMKVNLVHAHQTEEMEAIKLTTLYSFVLEKLYGLMADKAVGNMIHYAKDEATGLNRYFRVEFDSRFVDLEFDGVLPEINFDNVQLVDESKFEFLQVIQRILPLEQLRFTGFSLLNIEEITSNYVIEKIKNIIVNLSPGQFVYDDISKSLKELLGNNSLDVGLMPVLKVNDKLVVNCVEDVNEQLVATCEKYKLSMDKYMSAIDNYAKNPQIVFRKNVSEVLDGEDDIFPVLRTMGVEGLIVLPIYFQKQLVGVLTIYSKEKDALQEQMLSALEPVIPLLEQLLQTSIDDFKIVLDNTVKEKFTFLQPSVEWRFNEVAFDYLQQKERDKKAEVQEVHFRNVYPLYGAVDIRNSTLERNYALRADMVHQLHLCITILEKLKKEKELGLTNEIIFKAERWLHQINSFISSDDEFQLNLFFEDEVKPYLQHFRDQYPTATVAAAMDQYFDAVTPDGSAHTHRRELEESFQMLNRTIGNLLEQMNVEIQGAYPCYFEKYRSDGIEYDIYIGQSVTPNQPFHQLYLKNLRLWQLNSMAIVAKLTNSLQEQLPNKLQTTQLIFVHANTIDISFRNDEHRFDVEGAYNIRYEMIKKRIDKVLIKNTNERLTQPGKIALVYFQQKDIEEYTSHIHYLQSQHILAEDIEYLELEELQGVSGLKAIRVGVVLDNDNLSELQIEEQLLQLAD